MTARDRWANDSEFSRRQTDFDTQPNFVAATFQIQSLLALKACTRIVEVGSGSGRYLAYLANRLGLPVVGSDIPSPRLEQAREEFPSIEFEAADAVQMVRRHAAPDTLFLAMNVLGNLDPTEVVGFFSGITSAVTFCARGVLSGPTATRTDRDGQVGWDHNYTDLLGGFTLHELKATPLPKFPGREAIVATAFREPT